VAAGPHRLELGCFVTPTIVRKRVYDLNFAVEGHGGYRSVPSFQATLRYSRFWGNFQRKLDLRAIELK
jgi:hypothetical protein